MCLPPPSTSSWSPLPDAIVSSRKRTRVETEGPNDNNNGAVSLNSSNKKSKYNHGQKVRFGTVKVHVVPSLVTTRVCEQHHQQDQEQNQPPKNTLWYTLEECAHMNESARAAVKEYRHNEQHKDLVRHVLCVASQCSYCPPPMAYLETVRMTVPEEARGLELGLLPLRMRQRRQEHVKSVVEAHRQQQQRQGEDVVSNQETTLANHARRSSQASRLFAKLLARDVAKDGTTYY
mmetsp:Transcript_13897/g.22365  ORF Transcript_13897/g.22365 Transcript_13897/m.22365 type:complete len:233 (+) Transcript_13897:306-1004(+)|eukprot:CAMPEP_0178752350 /NCGR_PEP_ID=MMETSP0744-20121128/11020_1 /TAXON_ID=913974 /ORGANISM="Nitzschia punctata, Strain CCMP561" /LENGTH=232 /DNA_ID=CAMNT_0020406071 /DNA_START=229 /DNA_END=927 /DNA_ORIENTATION=-